MASIATWKWEELSGQMLVKYSKQTSPENSCGGGGGLGVGVELLLLPPVAF